jgi:hypothetical protein
MMRDVFRHGLLFLGFGYETDQAIDVVSKVLDLSANISASLHEYNKMQAGDFDLISLSGVKYFWLLSIYA